MKEVKPFVKYDDHRKERQHGSKGIEGRGNSAVERKRTRE
jgi:hypothetical protein